MYTLSSGSSHFSVLSVDTSIAVFDGTAISIDEMHVDQETFSRRRRRSVALSFLFRQIQTSILTAGFHQACDP